MENKNSSLKQFITQFILIVFSVVLGLYLSERIEDRKKKRESEELLSTIKSEVVDNIRLIEEWQPYHLEINNNLDSLSKDEEFIEEFIDNRYTLLDKLLTKGTFMGRRPASDAWDIAKSHPLIVNIDYEKWMILSRVYNQQEVTFEPAMELIELLESRDVNEQSVAQQNLEIMANHWRDFVAREEQLVYYFRQAEEILNLATD